MERPRGVVAAMAIAVVLSTGCMQVPTEGPPEAGSDEPAFAVTVAVESSGPFRAGQKLLFGVDVDGEPVVTGTVALHVQADEGPPHVCASRQNATLPPPGGHLHLQCTLDAGMHTVWAVVSVDGDHGPWTSPHVRIEVAPAS